MITAHKNPLLEALIYRSLVRPALRRSFDRIAIAGPYPQPFLDVPTLIYANHPSWWDGYIAFLLSDEVWHCESYLMMEQPQLKRYGFFRYCGVFGVDRHDPRDAIRSVAYAADLLCARSQRVLWIFPQGEITPVDRRPLHTYSGAAHIAKRASRVRCIPMALRFEFTDQQRPEALIRLGAAHLIGGDVNVKTLHREMDQRLLSVTDQLRDDTISGATAHYHAILRGRASVNVVWDRVRSVVRRNLKPGA